MSEQQRLSPGRVGPCPFCGNPLTQKRGKVNPYARCETEDCFGSRCPVVNLDDPRSVAAWNARAVGLAQAESMASLSASEVACYRWPEDTTEHRAMRAAFCDGAALSAASPSPVAVEHAAIIDRITSITTWLREPDSIEEASLEWLMDWMDRRPIAELAMVAMLMPGPVVSSTHSEGGK